MSTKVTEKRPKGKNISEEQKKILVEWVVKHPQLNTKKFSANFTLKDSQRLWEEVTIILNSCVGATKTWQLWRKVNNAFFEIIIIQHFFNYKLFNY